MSALSPAIDLNPANYGMEQAHVKRMLRALLLSIALHAIAWQWVWHPGKFAAHFDTPQVLDVILAKPLPIQSTPVAVTPPVASRKAMHPHTTLAPQPSASLPDISPARTAMPVTERMAEGPAPSAPAAEPAAPAPAADVVTVPTYDAAYLHNPKPNYPLAARKRGIEGQVLLRAEIQPDGQSSRIELKRSSGSDMLDQAALQAVKTWRFEPARRNNRSVLAWVEIPITFKLDN